MAGCFISTATGEQISLDEAVERGLVQARFDEAAGKPDAEPSYEIKTYAIGFVLDQVRAASSKYSFALPSLDTSLP